MKKRTNFWLILLTCLTVLTFACAKKEPVPETPKLSPEEAAEARRTIVDWLECEECEDGELEAVAKLGEIAVPTLAATLDQGPSPANREELYRHLTRSYSEITEYSRTHPEAKLEMTEEEYVKAYMDNYEALYRSRAATALAMIGGDDARKALEAARDARLREDVQSVVDEGLENWAQQQ
ncbi:MAG: hypothetical protein WBO54_13775 [Thermoanaerobaculia bacterium]